MVDELTKRREAKAPHLAGQAICSACKHEWIAVCPIGTTWLDCPSCLREFGRMRGVCAAQPENIPHWVCGCGCDVFHITKELTYCIDCGAAQTFK